MTITANQLKVNGVQLIEKMLQDVSQLLVSVRGKPKYVIIPVEDYEEMRDAELDRAINDSKEDIKNGRYHTDTQKFFNEVGL